MLFIAVYHKEKDDGEQAGELEDWRRSGSRPIAGGLGGEGEYYIKMNASFFTINCS